MTASVYTMEGVSKMTAIKKDSIRATGDDANALFISLACDQALEDWDREGHGSENFRRMVKEAIEARKLLKAKQPAA